MLERRSFMKKLLKGIPICATVLMCGLFVGGIHAEATGGARAYLTLTATKSTANVEENYPPTTPKSLDGRLEYKNIFGTINSAPYSGSLKSGNLSVVKNAPADNKVYRSYFNWKLNGILQPGQIMKYY